jgi:hypothetical protein
MGGILASANLDALTKEGFWKNLHVAEVIATLGGVAWVVPDVWYWCVSAQLLVIGTVWKLKLVLPEKVATTSEEVEK